MAHKSGRIGYIATAIWGVPNSSKRRRKSVVANNLVCCLHFCMVFLVTSSAG